jgi:endonuclease/exonuclease/phosphatase family metal-dependent hydrolase
VQVTPEYQLRLVGVHLKSKLPSPEGEALTRRAEAQQVRMHIEQILTTDPEANLLCYGDFNDARNTTTFQEITGPRGTAARLSDLPARDLHGDRWTHYWKAADLYSRIDYLFVSNRLAPEVVKDSATVHRSARWNEASDHRPIYTRILPVDR